MGGRSSRWGAWQCRPFHRNPSPGSAGGLVPVSDAGLAADPPSARRRLPGAGPAGLRAVTPGWPPRPWRRRLMPGPIARVEGITYTYPGADSPSLRSVDLEIGPGLTLIAGSSGGGKSTLLRLFDGLVPQFHGGRISGAATVAGLDPLRTPIRQLAQRVGLVFQDVETQSVYGVVESEIAFGLENVAMPRAEMHDRVDEILAELSIEHLRGRRPTTLSGGERQLVQLAAVLALRPELVALDEPTSQLDPEGAEAVLAACVGLAGRGRAVVVAEHRLETLLPAADRTLRVENGRVEDDALEGYSTAGPAPRAAPRPRSAGTATAWAMRGVVAGPAGRAGAAILEDVDLAGAAGEVVILMGPNGSGKTTLLRKIAKRRRR